MTLSQRNIYIEDDWNDDRLKNRDSVSEGYFLHPSDNLLDFSGDVEAGDALKGIYRPEWNGFGPGTISSLNGRLAVDGGGINTDDFAYAITSSFFVSGIWSFDWQQSSGAGNMYVGVISVERGSSNEAPKVGYALHINDTNQSQFDLERYDDNTGTNPGGTSIITGSKSNDGTEKSARVERDSYGNWEIFDEGSSEGTTNDTNYTKCRHLTVGSDRHVSYMDNLEVK